ncbi:MAG TPA: hypothetical protein VKV79_03565 [Terriglobia bacterium]|nr:hypothetical protein [Terriglobia bacterium]
MKLRHGVFVFLSILALVISGAASSALCSDMHIIFDPPSPPTTITTYLLLQDNAPLTVSWTTCNQPGFPSKAGYTACLGFTNLTGGTINKLALEFTVPNTIPPNPLVGQTLDCTTTGLNLTDNTCPSGTLSAGETADLAFFGGEPVPNMNVFFIGETGVDLADLPPFTVTPNPTPEPDTWLLFPTGLAILGLWGFRRWNLGSVI